MSVSACPQGSTAAGTTCTLRFTLMGFMCSSESKNQDHSQASPSGWGLIRSQAHQCLGQELSEPLQCPCWVSVCSAHQVCQMCSCRVHTAAPRFLLSCFALSGDEPYSCCNQSEALQPVSCSTDTPEALEMWSLHAQSMGCATLSSTHPRCTAPHSHPSISEG